MFQRQDQTTYQVTVSFLEIYNEQVRDLLQDLKDYDGELPLKTYIKKYINGDAKESRYKPEEQDKAFNPYN